MDNLIVKEAVGDSLYGHRFSNDDPLYAAAKWASYYRENPEEFAKDFLHLALRLFQKIMIAMMFWCSSFVLVACRGIGKTFIAAVYSVIRCVLYPGTQICVVSGTRGQGILVLNKIIEELLPRSPELKMEIDKYQISASVAEIVFRNTSVIRVVTASSDNARGNRGNVLIIDEYRTVPKDVITTVLRKFLTLKRQPLYEELTKEQRLAEYEKETNLTIWLSSAWYKDHWSYTQCEDTFNNMVKLGRRQFICGFPYQLSLAEGLLDRTLVEDEMLDSDFSDVKFGMEMGAEWYGAGEDAFFDYNSISKNRKIGFPMMPPGAIPKGNMSKQLEAAVGIKPKENGEKRILSADIALMASRRHKNDATAIFVNQMIPTKSGKYISNIVYADAWEGMNTQSQALQIRALFDLYDCDYLAIDANGVGAGVVDLLLSDISDPEAGEIYPALSCINDKDMAARCSSPNAKKAIWSIKASAAFNSDCAFLLREGFRSGRIRLLAAEYEAEELLGDVKGYTTLSPYDKVKLQLPYIHTTLLVDELTKLQHEENNGKIRISEKTGERKDRYSSLAYNYYVFIQIENKLNKVRRSDEGAGMEFVARAPSLFGKGGRCDRRQFDHSRNRNLVK